jgi:hypothetical protein
MAAQRKLDPGANGLLWALFQIEFHILKLLGQLARSSPSVLNGHIKFSMRVLCLNSCAGSGIFFPEESLKSRVPRIAIPAFWESI